MLLLLQFFLLLGCGVGERFLAVGGRVSAARGAFTLRQAAAKRGLLVGAAVQTNEYGQPDPLLIDPMYAQTLIGQYSMIEAENAMKWNVIHPAPTRYDFGPGDQLVAFAQAHDIRVRGHNLCWNADNPAWLKGLAGGSPSAAAKVLHDHIATVVAHYRGKIFAWDVVNEALEDNPPGRIKMKNSVWYNQPGIGLSGTDYVEQAFRWAHEADPDALLFYNDYDIEVPGPKFQAVFAMLKDFVSRGVPINGVGMQMHLDNSAYLDPVGLAQNMQQIMSLGLQVHITEMDVRIAVDSHGNASTAQLLSQANKYQQVISVCIQQPACKAFQTWGFTDKYSWVPSHMKGYGAALPFDAEYRPKPAYKSMIKVLTGTATN
jgi:endo-1,4-beta-xylanase